MTEKEFFVMLEKYAGGIVKEIMTPIENKIRAQIQDCDVTLNKIDALVDNIKKTQTKLTKDMTKLKSFVEQTDIEKNENIKQETIDEVKLEIEDAKKAATKAFDRINNFDLYLEKRLSDCKVTIDEQLCRHISIFDDHANTATRDITRQFELQCVQYFQGIERKYAPLEEALKREKS